MKLIIGKNDSGKTRELIKQSLETNTPIFALYESKAEAIRNKSFSYFGKIATVLTPNDLTSYSGEILVDDLEKAFAALLADYVGFTNFTIAGATITED
jgi:hypothetical protein